MTYLIGITGRARSGKDTAANILVKWHDYSQTAFAEPLKRMAAILCNEPESLFHDDAAKESVCRLHGKTRRQILQLLGTECVKPYFGEGVWVRHLFDRLDKGLYGQRVVITDVRFDAEADAILEAGGYILEIRRSATGLTGDAAAHRSEAGISPDKVDFTIINDGTISDLAAELAKVAAFVGRPE